MAKAMGPDTESFGASVADRPVPRISIHAFCESPETGSTIQRAGQDRRLSKAHLTVHMGGVFGAVEYFTESSTPNVVIVETRESGERIMHELERLAQVCDSGTKVIVIGGMNDIRLYRHMIRQGVNEYLVAPLQPLQVIEAISSLYNDNSSGPIGKIYAFVGARGGTGSSTIAHNTAWAIAQNLQIATTVIDFDVAFGTCGLNFNQDLMQGVAEALASPERLDDVLLDRLLVKHTSHLNLFVSPAQLDREAEITPEAVETVIEVVRQAVPCVVLDLPHIWAPWVKHALTSADEIVLVANPDLSSLRNGKNMYDMLNAARPNDNPVRLVLSQVGVPRRPEIPVKDFGEAMGTAPELVVPFDPVLFSTAANNGQMVSEINANARSSQCFRDLAQKLTGREPKVDIKPSRGLSLDFLKRKKAG
ncbi:MAG TPA: CtpF protein [Alphaproteobacteria bacterium]|nr:CtpF protein [Alphaproteobacteria bacterium]HAJ47017.1 CtpF protein [Alphaproteobacteria bacterium]